MQHPVVALVSGKEKRNGWVAQVGVADLRCLRLIPPVWFEQSILMPPELGVLLNKGVSFYV
jgi:hypothetical protein